MTSFLAGAASSGGFIRHVYFGFFSFSVGEKSRKTKRKMDENAALRNFRDFLTIYNQMAENCFNRCVISMNSRNLASEEERCADRCAGKQINVNHKMMAVYMEVHPLMTQKRADEMQKQIDMNEQPIQTVTETQAQIREAQVVNPSDESSIPHSPDVGQ